MWSLEDLGWNQEWARAFAPFAGDALVAARVAVAHRGGVTVYAAEGDLRARLSGRLLHEGEDLAVGDWVAVRPGDDGEGRIEAVLPRRTAIVRRAAGTAERAQVLAANVDLVLVVAGLDGDFNPRRVERTLVALGESGAEVVVLLNKADAADDVAGRQREMERAAPGVAVHAMSALTGAGVEAARREMAAGRTVVLLGSSGAGKSTLANRLLGDERQATQAVRADDARGRHTTTRRELFVLPGGGVLIDTPGLRELQLWASTEAAGAAFGDLDDLAAGCRFGNCQHEREPGCAVAAAVREGRLEAGRLESYRKLKGELRHAEARVDARARSEQERRWRVIHKAARRHRPRE